MIARAPWVLVFCLSVVVALAGEPEGSDATRQSQVPRRRVRRTYDHQVQFRQPGTETAVAPPEKETFVPGVEPAKDISSQNILTRQPASFTPPPQIHDPRKKEGEEEEDDEEKDDLWVLKSAEEVLGVSTNKSVSSVLGGWIAEDMEARNRSGKNPEGKDEAEREGEEDAEPLNILTGREGGSPSLLVRMENLSSNAAEHVRSPSDPNRSDLSSTGPETDRFAPRPDAPLNREDTVRDNARVPAAEPSPRMVVESAMPKVSEEIRPEEPASIRAPPSGAGSFATKWEPPAITPARAPESPAGSYGRMGTIFSPEPAVRAPSSLGLPPPGSGYGSGPAPLPDTRFKAFDTPAPLLPPIRNDHSVGPPKHQVQPFLPGRFEP